MSRKQATRKSTKSVQAQAQANCYVYHMYAQQGTVWAFESRVDANQHYQNLKLSLRAKLGGLGIGNDPTKTYSDITWQPGVWGTTLTDTKANLGDLKTIPAGWVKPTIKVEATRQPDPEPTTEPTTTEDTTMTTTANLQAAIQATIQAYAEAVGSTINPELLAKITIENIDAGIPAPKPVEPKAEPKAEPAPKAEPKAEPKDNKAAFAKRHELRAAAKAAVEAHPDLRSLLPRGLNSKNEFLVAVLTEAAKRKTTKPATQPAPKPAATQPAAQPAKPAATKATKLVAATNIPYRDLQAMLKMARNNGVTLHVKLNAKADELRSEAIRLGLAA